MIWLLLISALLLAAGWAWRERCWRDELEGFRVELEELQRDAARAQGAAQVATQKKAQAERERDAALSSAVSSEPQR